MSTGDLLFSTLVARESYRDHYWRKHDPIVEDRLLWRAHTFRHTVHLLPGQTILELGCGQFHFTRALLQVSRKENPIAAATFQSWPAVASDVLPDVELIQLQDFPGALAGRQFDFIVAMDLLDRRNSSALLGLVHDLLTPGGEMVFYESNPWNPVYKIKTLVARAFGRRDPRNLIDRPGLYELLSEIGFIRIYAVFNDFVFAPLTRPSIWFCAISPSFWRMPPSFGGWRVRFWFMRRNLPGRRRDAPCRYATTNLSVALFPLLFPATTRR